MIVLVPTPVSSYWAANICNCKVAGDITLAATPSPADGKAGVELVLPVWFISYCGAVVPNCPCKRKLKLSVNVVPAPACAFATVCIPVVSVPNFALKSAVAIKSLIGVALLVKS